MKFGITISRIDEIDLAVRAEELGYDFCWVFDSPMIRSNLWAVLTLVADRTSTLRIGPGVAVPALRMAPETANGIATINALAPGRTFLGLGTGNTALRAMGQVPMTLSAFREHVEVIRGLLAGGPVPYQVGGRTHDISFQNADQGHIDLEHPVPIHLAGFGPRAQALAGELGDGLITALPRGGAVTDALANVRRGAARNGRDLDRFETTALVTLILLDRDETLSSPRVVQAIGSSVMVNVHYHYDRHREQGTEPPESLLPIWERYVAFRSERDRRVGAAQAHGTHYNRLDSDESRFVTPDLIRQVCIAGRPGEVRDQLAELERDGLDGIVFVAPDDRRQELLETFAANVIEPLRR